MIAINRALGTPLIETGAAAIAFGLIARIDGDAVLKQRVRLRTAAISSQRPELQLEHGNLCRASAAGRQRKAAAIRVQVIAGGVKEIIARAISA